MPTEYKRCDLGAIFALAERLRPEIEAWPEWQKRACDAILDVPPFDRRARARAVEALRGDGRAEEPPCASSA